MTETVRQLEIGKTYICRKCIKFETRVCEEKISILDS